MNYFYPLFSCFNRFTTTIMRSFKEFLNDIVRKPPLLFPLVALFHVLWLLWTIWDDRKEPMDIAWLQVVWLAVFVFLWIEISDLRKWAAIAYFIFTLLDVSLALAAKTNIAYFFYPCNLVGFDVLFSVLILIFYRRLTK